MDKSMSELHPAARLTDYLPEFIEAFKVQLEADHERWGLTWMNRPKKGQELRTKARYNDYFDMFEHAGVPVSWLKVIGGAFICWVRENHPELCIDKDESEVSN